MAALIARRSLISCEETLCGYRVVGFDAVSDLRVVASRGQTFHRQLTKVVRPSLWDTTHSISCFSFSFFFHTTRPPYTSREIDYENPWFGLTEYAASISLTSASANFTWTALSASSSDRALEMPMMGAVTTGFFSTLSKPMLR